jgi:hypothetical protein
LAPRAGADRKRVRVAVVAHLTTARVFFTGEGE